MMENMSEVIILGSGIAGLCAAYSAIEAGAKNVTVISAFPVGSTQIAPWGVIRTEGVEGKDIYSSIIDYGRGISKPWMVEVLIEELPEALAFVRRFVRTVPAAKVGYKLEGGGALFSKTLTKCIKKLGGRFITAECVEIISENNSVKGILLFDGKEYVTIPAKTVVLACGGGSSLFASSDNPVTQTGGGYALALRAGAVLKDMEFQIYHPMAKEIHASKALRYRMLEMFRLENCLVTDNCGNRLYDIEELLNSHKSHSQLGEMALRIYNHQEIFVTAKDKKIIVKPVVHSFSGGVIIDKSGMTNVKGLFACGEVVGGLNGANRIAGTSFPESIIFGKISGRSAAAYSLGFNKRDGSLEPLYNASAFTMNWDEFKPDRISNILENNLFILKNKHGLMSALQELSSIRQEFIQSIEKLDILKVREYNRALVAEAITQAALKRCESRGCFYRSDCTNENSMLAKSILIKLDGNRLVAEYEKKDTV